MKSPAFSGVAILAATFFCLDTALAQPVGRTTTTAIPVGRTANATAAPSVLQSILDRLSALEMQTRGIGALETQVAQLQSALAAETAARQKADEMLATVTMQHMDLLRHFSRDGDDIFITGANLHIVNGIGMTERANGLGNLIIGYNELRDLQFDINERSGSHMLVVGKENNYSGYGGIVVGLTNSTSGSFSSVSGGTLNTSTGSCSSVFGGSFNMASGVRSSVSGGERNTASGESSSVSGGGSNLVRGLASSVSGGRNNRALASYSSVSGGDFNTASGISSSVSGGNGNIASGGSSSISGGLNRAAAIGLYDWVAGLLFQDK